MALNLSLSTKGEKAFLSSSALSPTSPSENHPVSGPSLIQLTLPSRAWGLTDSTDTSSDLSAAPGHFHLVPVQLL